MITSEPGGRQEGEETSPWLAGSPRLASELPLPITQECAGIQKRKITHFSVPLLGPPLAPDQLLTHQSPPPPHQCQPPLEHWNPRISSTLVG